MSARARPEPRLCRSLSDAQIFAALAAGIAGTRDLLLGLERSLLEPPGAATALNPALSSCLQELDRACQRLQDLGQMAATARETSPMRSPDMSEIIANLPRLAEIRQLLARRCQKEDGPDKDQEHPAQLLSAAPSDPLF